MTNGGCVPRGGSERCYAERLPSNGEQVVVTHSELGMAGGGTAAFLAAIGSCYAVGVTDFRQFSTGHLSSVAWLRTTPGGVNYSFLSRYQATDTT